MKLPIFDSYTTFKKRRLIYHEIKSHKMTNNQKKIFKAPFTEHFLLHLLLRYPSVDKQQHSSNVMLQIHQNLILFWDLSN